MKQATGSNTPQSINKVSIQLTLDGHSFSAPALSGEFPGDGPVEVELLTGRHHQIRVQFSHAGYPLAGDAKYGAKEKGSLALCAHHLELKHPRTGKRLSFTVKPEGEIFHSFV